MYNQASTEEQCQALSARLETMKHREVVRKLMTAAAKELLDRADRHDDSKLQTPEVEIFDQYTHQLASLTYGSADYKSTLEKIKPALEHHYANNTHHPEHYKQGVNDMDLFDVLEMLLDWKAASSRHNNGNILQSLSVNRERHGLSDQLHGILQNTVERYLR